MRFFNKTKKKSVNESTLVVIINNDIIYDQKCEDIALFLDRKFSIMKIIKKQILKLTRQSCSEPNCSSSNWNVINKKCSNCEAIKHQSNILVEKYCDTVYNQLRLFPELVIRQYVDKNISVYIK